MKKKLKNQRGLIDFGLVITIAFFVSQVVIVKKVEEKRCADKVAQERKKAGINDAVVTGHATIEDRPLVLAAMDFQFIGGSMGSVVGEKITRAFEKALSEKSPVIVISCSGGARMQEGVLSLMQLMKTSAAAAFLDEEGIPYISVITDPTTGGVTASYAMLGDINIAEPDALIGFAGPRVIKQTIGQDLPEGFQRSEFLLEHGFVDAIVERKNMKEKLFQLLTFFVDEKQEEPQPEAPNYI